MMDKAIEVGSVRDLRVEELLPVRVDLAFPLVQTAMPEITLPRWRSFAHGVLKEAVPRGTRILTAENERGIIVGLVICRTFNDLRHGLALQVEHLVALDLFDRACIVEKLAAALEAVALELGCGAIHTALADPPVRPSSAQWLAGLLRNRGHSIEGLFLCKPLAIE